MKSILFIMLFFIIPLNGCATRTENRDMDVERLSLSDGGTVTRNDKLIILTVPGEVRKGEMASVEIQGAYGVSYTITATYRVNNEKRTTHKTMIAPRSGIIIWNFKVENNTNPGVYAINISGGAQEVNTSYRVIE